MIFATNFVRQPVIIVAGMELLAMISVSVQGQGTAKPAKLKHSVIAEPVFGAIRPRGYLPVRITIDRQGTQAVDSSDITYSFTSRTRFTGAAAPIPICRPIASFCREEKPMCPEFF